MSIESTAASEFTEHLSRKGDADRTLNAYHRVIGDYTTFLRWRGCSVKNASSEECGEWVEKLREEHSDSTVYSYIGYVNHLYNWLSATGEIDANPMYEARKECSAVIEKDPERRDISISEMRSFVATVKHPLEHAVIVTLLKTGVRVGELANLDMQDIGAEDGEKVLTVPAEIPKNEPFRGEERSAANKRSHTTEIPIDAELARALRRWLLIRPDPVSPAKPLFRSTGGSWGKRITPSMVTSMVKKHAEAHGWFEKGGDASKNVTPHYFRHFFTTWMRERIGETGSVAYLRGDTLDTGDRPYVHNWQNRAQKAYRENIYSIVGGGQ